MTGERETKPAAAARWGWAWVSLCGALAVHVADESLNDFLAVYNPTVLALRERIPYFPMPTFTFEGWLSGLIVGVVVLLALSPFAFRNSKWMVSASYLLGALMFLNGLIHLAVSIHQRRVMPGAYSAPLLLAASVFLVVSAARRPPPSEELHSARPTPSVGG